MAAIILPDRWKRQPQGEVELVSAWSNVFDFLILPGKTYPLRQGGFALTTNDARTLSGYTIGKYTVFTVARHRSTRSSIAIIKERSNGGEIHGEFFHDTGTTDLAKVRGIIVYGVGKALPTNIFNGCYKLDGTTATAIVDGCKSVATVAAAAVASGYFNSSTDADGGIDSEVYLVGASKHVVSDEMMFEFSDNPWQIFKPRKNILYFDAPSFPVLSSLAVSNITSSGGRLTAST